MGLHMDAAEMAKMNRARAALLVKLKRDPYVQWALPFRREEQLEWVREMAIADELTPQEHAHMGETEKHTKPNTKQTLTYAHTTRRGQHRQR